MPRNIPIAFDGRSLVDSHGPHKPVRIVLHDTESHDVKGISDLQGIANFWHNQGRGFGAHIGVDEEGKTARYVSDDQIAFHVALRNTGSLGIEQVGFASFKRGTWKRRPKQLRTVAKWLAHWSRKWDIPLKLDVEHGVSTHAMQSKAFGGDHFDPGEGYPLRGVLLLAKAYKLLRV